MTFSGCALSRARANSIDLCVVLVLSVVISGPKIMQDIKIHEESYEIYNNVQKSNWCRIFRLTIEDTKYIAKIVSLAGGTGGSSGSGSGSGGDNYAKFVNDIKACLKAKIGAAKPYNDGRQTPYYSHCIFKSFHACRCCCRTCLLKNYGIPKGRPLEAVDYERIIRVVLLWFSKQMKLLDTLAASASAPTNDDLLADVLKIRLKGRYDPSRKPKATPIKGIDPDINFDKSKPKINTAASAATATSAPLAPRKRKLPKTAEETKDSEVAKNIKAATKLAKEQFKQSTIQFSLETIFGKPKNNNFFPNKHMKLSEFDDTTLKRHLDQAIAAAGAGAAATSVASSDIGGSKSNPMVID